jgi:enamine deaminase RidA (YjgF/YER057c/UK114 family)
VDVERRGSGGPWEALVGYSRVVRAGELVLVSGCTAVTSDGAVQGGDSAYEQTIAALTAIERALATVGAQVGDVVQTRIYVTDMTRWEEVGRAHGEVFADVRPAATMVEVSALIDPRLLVEVEAMAHLPRDARNELPNRPV